MMLMTRHHRALLLKLQIGGCTCLTKTNEIKYHASDCQYRLACEIEEALMFEDDSVRQKPVQQSNMDPVEIAKEQASEWAPIEAREAVYCQVYCQKMCQNSVHGYCMGVPNTDLKEPTP
jgi:hypothetical protein